MADSSRFPHAPSLRKFAARGSLPDRPTVRRTPQAKIQSLGQTLRFARIRLRLSLGTRPDSAEAERSEAAALVCGERRKHLALGDPPRSELQGRFLTGKSNCQASIVGLRVPDRRKPFSSQCLQYAGNLWRSSACDANVVPRQRGLRRGSNTVARMPHAVADVEGSVERAPDCLPTGKACPRFSRRVRWRAFSRHLGGGPDFSGASQISPSNQL